MVDMQNTIGNAKDKVLNVVSKTPVPIPPEFHEQASVHELKSRLDWGEPALTILDVRSLQAFRQKRILGSVSVPLEALRQRTRLNLEASRDLYVYGETDAQTDEATQALRQSGYQRVAALQGGLSAWESAGVSTEGTEIEQAPVSSGSFNVTERLQEFSAEQRRER